MVKEGGRSARLKQTSTLFLFIALIAAAVSFPPEPVFASEIHSADPVNQRNQRVSFLLDRSDASAEGSDEIRFHQEPSAGEGSLLSWEYGRLLWQDTKFILTAPARWEKDDWLTFSLEASAVGAAFLLDRPIQEGMQRNRTRTTDRIARIFEPFGAEYSVAVLGGFYLVGVAFENPKAKAVTRDGLAASLVASVIVTPTIKIVAGRDRPAQSDGVYDFHPFRFIGDNSFPSGHTTQAFTVASVIATHYEPIWVKGAAYAVAALVGFARIEHNAHWASDVVAGAFIGSAVGSATVRFNEKQTGPFSWRPLIDRDRQGLALVFHFE